MFNRPNENKYNAAYPFAFIPDPAPGTEINHAQILGIYSGIWKLNVLMNLAYAPKTPPFSPVAPDEDTDNPDDAAPTDAQKGKVPVIAETEPMSGYAPVCQDKLEIDSNTNSSAPDSNVTAAFLTKNKTLFSFFVPCVNDQNINSLEARNFIIWDATCHIMGELAGSEYFGLFNKENVSDLAKKAIYLARVQLGIVCNEQAVNEITWIAGVAIWNLLLPESAGGVYPTKLYPKFIRNLDETLKQFWQGSEKYITPVVLKCAFSDFKEFAISDFKAEKEKRVNFGL